ncbi:MAG TPA: hypothetical protein PLJ27_23930, partial [Polyangiaceae bacterium]|nr:hypothetical protein [Polyangiaceae bacterium]
GATVVRFVTISSSHECIMAAVDGIRRVCTDGGMRWGFYVSGRAYRVACFFFGVRFACRIFGKQRVT